MLLVMGTNAVAGDDGIVPFKREEMILHGEDGVPWLVDIPCEEDGEQEDVVFVPDDGSGDVEMSEGQEDVCVILTSCLEVKLPAKNLNASVLLEKDLKKDPVNPSMLAINSRILVYIPGFLPRITA